MVSSTWSNSRTKKNRKYRSSRSVRRREQASSSSQQWTRLKLFLLVGGIAIMLVLTLSPMLVLQRWLEQDLKHGRQRGGGGGGDNGSSRTSGSSHQVVGLSTLLERSKQILSVPTYTPPTTRHDDKSSTRTARTTRTGNGSNPRSGTITGNAHKADSGSTTTGAAAELHPDVHVRGASSPKQHFKSAANDDDTVAKQQQRRRRPESSPLEPMDAFGATGKHANNTSSTTTTTTTTAATHQSLARSNQQQEQQDSNPVATTKQETAKDNHSNKQQQRQDSNDNANNHHDHNSLPTTSTREELQLARGASGLPWEATPALHGAKRGTIQCDDPNAVRDMAYWNHPQGFRDQAFATVFSRTSQTGQQDDHGDNNDASADDSHKNTRRYLTFEPDCGGWNNIRMSMEVIFVLAAATGRTLVLPPATPHYLLGDGKAHARSFANFYPLIDNDDSTTDEDITDFAKRVRVISMEDFVIREGQRLLHLNQSAMEQLRPTARLCLKQPKETQPQSCEWLYPILRQAGVQPILKDNGHCLIFDEQVFRGGNLTAEKQARVDKFCTENRKVVLYTHELHDPPLIHWRASELEYRLLNHFYAMLYFTDPAVDNYYKRFVRDFLHYKDEVFCAAGKIVHALQTEAAEAAAASGSGNGLFSTLHVRRGDFQFKEVKISAGAWYNNSKEIWKPGEILYIATDERNKTWFEPIAKHHRLRFLDDYWDMAKLGDLDSSFIGMVDTIVASHGRTFCGTWFSTYTGFINRMRGYLGYSMTDSWYSYLPRKTIMHRFESPHGNFHAREFHVGWVGIDGDEYVDHEREVPVIADKSVANRTVPKLSLSELQEDSRFSKMSLSRGVAGRPIDETPALNGAARAHIECDINVDSLAYWNDPQGIRDVDFKSPFAVESDTKYISFVPDRGGWNNVRMSMEIIFVIAAATGRTLVLPPEQPLYLLHKDKGKRQRGFADFFPLHAAEFQKRVPVITMEEFLKREGDSNGRLPIPEANKEAVLNAASHCEKREKGGRSCTAVSEYLAKVGHSPTFRAKDGCVVFDEDAYHGRRMSPEHSKSALEFCGDRNITFWNTELEDPVLIHFRAGEKEFRMLTHYYLMLHFTDPSIDHYFKRFVRDFLHYHDSIYCAAGKIVKALQAEAAKRGFAVDDEGAGGYSAMHIRRGDFQYKRVKIPAEEWYENTKELWLPNEILYIATDERNKTWFDPIAKHHTIRFLDDFWDIAGLSDADPNHFGMLDTIIASRSRAFAGTWFSTFTGYVNRMRGYHGMSMLDSWYSFLPKKTAVHEWKNYAGSAYAYESPVGWIGIDSDVAPSKDKF